jgi:hypothetical protein
VFDTGNRYHLVHSALIALAPAACARPHVVRCHAGALLAPLLSRRILCSRTLPHAREHAGAAQVGALFAGGTALFCGSCYAVAATQDRAVGRAAPVGGTMLIAAWLALALP